MKHVMCFSCSVCFSEQKTVFKHCKQKDPKFPSSRYFRRYWGNSLTCWAVGLKRLEINVFVDQEVGPHRLVYERVRGSWLPFPHWV